MTDSKKYHIQLAVFEVTKEGEQDETWDWVQEVDFCTPVDSLEETAYPLTLMYAALEFFMEAFYDKLNVPSPIHPNDAETIEEMTKAVEKATMEMLPEVNWDKLTQLFYRYQS